MANQKHQRQICFPWTNNLYFYTFLYIPYTSLTFIINFIRANRDKIGESIYNTGANNMLEHIGGKGAHNNVVKGMCMWAYLESVQHWNVLECEYINNLVCSCVVRFLYRVCACVHISLSTLMHLVHAHVTLLIIPLQTAVWAPAEAVGLKLDLFHLKDQICPETRTSEVTPHRLLWNLEVQRSGKYQWGEDVCTHILQNTKKSNGNTVYIWRADCWIRMADISHMDLWLVIIMW